MQVKKPEVRKKLLIAAKAEFTSNGYERADMRSIASAAGFTVGNIYRYFENKEDLFNCVVNEPLLTTERERLVLKLERILNKEDRLLRHLDTFSDHELRAMVAGIIG